MKVVNENQKPILAEAVLAKKDSGFHPLKDALHHVQEILNRLQLQKIPLVDLIWKLRLVDVGHFLLPFMYLEVWIHANSCESEEK